MTDLVTGILSLFAEHVPARREALLEDEYLVRSFPRTERRNSGGKLREVSAWVQAQPSKPSTRAVVEATGVSWSTATRARRTY